MTAKQIISFVEEAISGLLKENGMKLYDCEFVKEGSAKFLRIYVDKTDGTYVGTDDCEKVSRYMSEKLDDEDIISGDNYYLEVSSPGLSRTLSKPEHFTEYIGRNVDVKLYKPVNGNKLITGKLTSFDDGRITIIEDGGLEHIFEQKEYAKVNLTFEF